MAEDEEPHDGERDPRQPGFLLAHEVVVAVDGVPGAMSTHDLHSAGLGLILDQGVVVPGSFGDISGSCGAGTLVAFFASGALLWIGDQDGGHSAIVGSSATAVQSNNLWRLGWIFNRSYFHHRIC